jgi:hypothetical protein
MAHGFFATTINGQRVLQHGGDTVLFHSELMLVPQQGVGLFVSYNSMTGGSGGSELETAFMDRYFPAQRVALKSPADFKTRLNSYIGSFDLARRNYSTPEKILGLVQYFTVSPGPDDTLLMTSSRSPGGVDQWVETKPGVFKLAGDGCIMLFCVARQMLEPGRADPLRAADSRGLGLHRLRAGVAAVRVEKNSNLAFLG